MEAAWPVTQYLLSFIFSVTLYIQHWMNINLPQIMFFKAKFLYAKFITDNTQIFHLYNWDDVINNNNR